MIQSNPFCTSCGAELRSGSSFCGKCGTTVEQGYSNPQPAYNNFQGNRRLSPHVHSGGKPSAAWWLLPLFLGWLGGIIAWIGVKDRDPRMAKKCLILGIIPSVIAIAIIAFIGLFQLGSSFLAYDPFGQTLVIWWESIWG